MAHIEPDPSRYLLTCRKPSTSTPTTSAPAEHQRRIRLRRRGTRPPAAVAVGPASSGARATPADADPAGRNRIHLIVQDLDAPRSNGSRAAGVAFRTDVLADRPILLADPAGNLIKLFQPADSR